MPTDSITMRTWAHGQLPGREVVVASEPEPILLEHNLVCLASDPEVARGVLVEWERIVEADGAVGYLALGEPSAEPSTNAEVDREIGRRTLKRILLGGLPGAVLFGVVVAAVVWLVTGWSSGTVIGAFLGGLAFGMVPGALLTYVRGTGWGSAYEDSHAPTGDLAAAIASIHADVEAPISEAAESAAGHEGVRLLRLDRSGTVID